jgi:hypothetical protein
MQEDKNISKCGVLLTRARPLKTVRDESINEIFL